MIKMAETISVWALTGVAVYYSSGLIDKLPLECLFAVKVVYWTLYYNFLFPSTGFVRRAAVVFLLCMSGSLYTVPSKLGYAHKFSVSFSVYTVISVCFCALGSREMLLAYKSPWLRVFTICGEGLYRGKFLTSITRSLILPLSYSTMWTTAIWGSWFYSYPYCVLFLDSLLHVSPPTVSIGFMKGVQEGFLYTVTATILLILSESTYNTVQFYLPTQLYFASSVVSCLIIASLTLSALPHSAHFIETN